MRGSSFLHFDSALHNAWESLYWNSPEFMKDSKLCYRLLCKIYSRSNLQSSSQDCFLHSSLALCDRFSLFNVQFDIFSLRHSTYSWHRSFCSPLNIYLIHVQVNLSFSWSLEPRCCSLSISASRDAFVFVRINTQFTCSRLQEYVL